MAEKSGKKIISENRKAHHEFFIDEVIECGMVLTGTEIKSVRAGSVNLKESYATIKNGEVFVTGMHISPYKEGNIYNADPLRDRKLLLHKSEINKLIGKVQQKGVSLVPLEIYLMNGRAKMGLAVARGKKLYDKRDAIAEKDAKREIDRRLKEQFRN